MLGTCFISLSVWAGGSIFGGGKHKTSNPNGVYSIGVHICSSLECPDIRIISGSCDGEHMEKRWGVCICDKGYVSINGRCWACPEGQYSDGIHGCTGCAEGTYKVNEADTECTPCPEDSYCIAGKAYACPEHADCSATDFTCTNGYTKTNTECVCAEGKYVDENGGCLENKCVGITLNQCQESCDPPTGKILNKVDETPCKNCEGNKCHLGTCIAGLCQDIIKSSCEWSDWYNSMHPEPGLSGGDFETFENLRKSGYQICDAPVDIECQAQLLPGMPLEKLGQKVTCDKNIGLICQNSEQTPPLCHNYKLRVSCCETGPIIECKEGTYLNDNDECVECDGFLDENGKCISCPPCFIPNDTHTNCILAVEHAFSCDLDGNPICREGYYRDGNQCLPCDGANEYSSQKGAERCSICYGDALALEDHTGCNCEEHAICSDDLSGKILWCEPGYFLLNEHCIQCPTEHVDSCDENGFKCAAGYNPVLSDENQTSECIVDPNHGYWRCTNSGHGTWMGGNELDAHCQCDEGYTGKYCEQEYCEPVCEWSQWFDVDYPKYEEGGGDFETYEKIRAAGKTICDSPKEVECQAENYPGLPLEQVGQRVHCDVRFGLICRNSEQPGLFKMCINYQVRALCCDYSHCPNQ